MPHLFQAEPLTREQTERVHVWIMALESGHFKQGTGALCQRTNNIWGFLGLKHQYCCLGVAAKIFDFDELCGQTLQFSYHELGLRTKDGAFEYEGKKISLIKCNDTLLWDFKHIAETIAQELKEHERIHRDASSIPNTD